MEALGTTSSVAGVLSLAGQTIDGIIKLHSFFQNVSSASRTIDRFLKSINQLIKLMEEVKSLLTSVVDSSASLGTDFKIAALEIQLEDCSKDIYHCLQLARDYHPGFSSGTKAGFKKFWVAINKGQVRGILEDIKEHRHGIMASLSVLERAMNANQSLQLSTVQKKMEEATQDSAVFQRDSMKQLVKIDSIEEHSRASLNYSHESMVSLASIASSIAEIERRLSLAYISSAQSIQSPEIRIQSNSSFEGQQSHLRRLTQKSKKKAVFSLGYSSEESASGSESIPSKKPASHLTSGKGMATFEQTVAKAVRKKQPSDEIGESFMDDDNSLDWEESAEDNTNQNLHENSFLSKAIDQILPGSSTVSSQSSGKSLELRSLTLLKTSKALYPPNVASYISKYRLLQSIEQQISILSLQTGYNNATQEHLSSFQKQLEELKCCLANLRSKCLLEGHSLHLIDEVLTSCKIHDPVTGLRRSPENIAIRHADLFALRKHTLKQKSLVLSVEQCYTKRDRINRWLFQNLQSSPENAGLHRSMMIGGMENEMDEKTWARTVVKYWSIDEAATGMEYEAVNISTNEAAHSDASSGKSGLRS